MWDFLKPRLRTLVILQKQWGSVHDVYGMQKGSMFEDAPVPKKIRDPDSSFSVYWDLFQIFFLVYVAYAVPARVGFQIELENWKFWFFFVSVQLTLFSCGFAQNAQIGSAVKNCPLRLL